MNVVSCIACVRPNVKTEQSARKPGLVSWMRLMSAKAPLRTSQASAEPTSRSNGCRAVASISVTSPVLAAVEAVIISVKSRLFLLRVLLDGELHGPIERKLDDAGLLIDPAVRGALLVFLLAQLRQVFAAYGSRMDSVVDVGSRVPRQVEVIDHPDEQREANHQDENGDQRCGAGGITHGESGFRQCGGRELESASWSENSAG